MLLELKAYDTHPEYRTFCESVRSRITLFALVPTSCIFKHLPFPSLLQPHNKVECGHLIRPSVANFGSPQNMFETWTVSIFH